MTETLPILFIVTLILIVWGLGSDHGNLLLIHYKAFMWMPFVMLRTPFSGVKSAP